MSRPCLQRLHGRGLFAVAGISVAINALLLALPLYSLQVFDRVLASRSVDTLWLLTAAALVALAAAALLDGLRARLLVRIANRLALDLEPRLLDATLASAAHSSRPSSQPLRDLGTVREFLAGARGLVALVDLPTVPLYVAIAYLVHPALGHAALCGALLLLLTAALTEWATADEVKAAGEASREAGERLDGMLRNADTVEAMGMRAALLRQWTRAHHEALALATRASDAGSALAAGARLARLLVAIALTGIGAYLAIGNEITIGAMVAAGIISARAFAPLDVLIGAWRNLVRARAALACLDKLLASQPQRPAPVALPAPRGHVQIEGVAYGEQPILRSISLEVPAGTILGLIGPSGAGKSALAKLICGVWTPRTGTVRLDGAAVRDWDREAFGRHIGYLPQDIALFDGTVRDNIARFGEAGDEAVVEAARMAGVHEMILKLPEGYHTRVGPAGALLSGGQRQRIALARALFGRPCLVVLDEPNSSLDTAGEEALLEALTALKRAGSTVLIITHRPSLLGAADSVALLVGGRLQRQGAAKALIGALLRPAPRIAAVAEPLHAAR